MTKTVAVIYPPPAEGLPCLAVVFMDERILACQPASTVEEGKAMLESIMQELPGIIDQAHRDQDAEKKDEDDASPL